MSKQSKVKSQEFHAYIGNSFRKWWGVRKPSFEIFREGKGWHWDYIYPNDFPFSIHCRMKKTTEFIHIFTRGEKAELIVWIYEALAKAAESKKSPLLIFKRSNYPELVGMSEETIELIRSKKLLLSEVNKDRFAIDLWLTDKSRIFFFKLDDFMKIDSDIFKEENNENDTKKNRPG